MTPPKTKFWVVYNPDGRTPTMMHARPELAVTEAKRLANNNHGQTFFVAEIKGYALVEKPDVFNYLDKQFEQDMELPF
jgi:hypothetical protein